MEGNNMSSFMVTERHMNVIYSHLNVKCASSTGRHKYFRNGFIETPRMKLEFDEKNHEVSLKTFVQELYKIHIRALNAQYPNDEPIKSYRMRISLISPYGWTQTLKYIECFMYQTEIHRLDEHDNIIYEALNKIRCVLMEDIIHLTDTYKLAAWEEREEEKPTNGTIGVVRLV